MQSQISKKFFYNIFIIYLALYIAFGDINALRELRITHYFSIGILPLFITVILVRSEKIKISHLLIIIIITSMMIISIFLRPIAFEDIYRYNTFIIIFLLPFIKVIIDQHVEFFTKKIIISLGTILTITIIDYLAFLATANSFFPVMFYITPRAQGPFFDPNFLGLVAAIFLLITIESKQHILLRTIGIISLIISGSFSAIVFTFFSIILSKKNIRNLKILPFIALISFFLFSFIYEKENYIILLIKNLSFLNSYSDLIEIKMISLFNRFESINESFHLIFENPFGYGNKSLLKYLTRDPHNSFVGVTFEYGVFAFIILCIPYFIIKKNDFNISIVYFSFFMALLLNIHYSSIFLASFFLYSRPYKKPNPTQSRSRSPVARSMPPESE